MKSKNITVSLFIDPDKKSFLEAIKLGADCVELHTGQFALAKNQEAELSKITEITKLAKKHNILIHAGHGLNFENIGKIIDIKEIREVNIGHSIVADALFNGLETSIKNIKNKLRKN